MSFDGTTYEAFKSYCLEYAEQIYVRVGAENKLLSELPAAEQLNWIDQWWQERQAQKQNVAAPKGAGKYDHYNPVQAGHAIQTGVGFLLAKQNPDLPDNTLRVLKHIRTGVDTAKAEHGGLVRLLIKKGAFTEAEYIEEMRLAYIREVELAEQVLATEYGVNITLA
jgi:hypothetical protein